MTNPNHATADPFADNRHAPIPAGVLRSPADADHYRVKIGRYGDRWYTDPHPGCDLAPATEATWPSISTVKKAGSGDWTFTALKRAAQALDADPTTLHGLDYAATYDRLKSINRVGLAAAGARGTQVHLYLERALRGQPLQAPGDHPNGPAYLPAVNAFLDTYQPELVAAELVCINRSLAGVGYGGTADAIIRIDGRLYLPDWKSRGADSDHGAYPDEAAQVGGLAAADYFIADTPAGPRRRPLPDLHAGLIVSIRPDGPRIYPIDLDKARAHWQALHAWWVARRDERAAIGKPWPPRAIPPAAPEKPIGLLNSIVNAKSRDELEALWHRFHHAWTDEHTRQAAGRIAELTNGTSR